MTIYSPGFCTSYGLWFAGRNRTTGVFDRGVINSKFRRILEGCFRRLVLGLPAIRHGIRLFTAWFVIGDIHLHSIYFDDFSVRSLSRSYRYYEEEGYPEGRSHEHWLRAEQEVRGRTDSAAPKTPEAEPTHADARTEEIMHVDQ